jgi:hypothetical protein
VDAFDADVLIYAATPGHPLGRRVAPLFAAQPGVRPPGKPAPAVGIGSVLLVPEVLAKPLKEGEVDVVRTLSIFLGRLDLRPVDRATAELATVLGARYNLRAADSIHLATAVTMGAHRFITNNSKDFGGYIEEIDVTFPSDLPAPATAAPPRLAQIGRAVQVEDGAAGPFGGGRGEIHDRGRDLLGRRDPVEW